MNVGATADGETAIDVFWDAPTDEGGAPVTQYEVQWSADGTSGWSRAGYANDPQNRTYKHTGLSSGATRHYRVAARNSGGRGPWSDSGGVRHDAGWRGGQAGTDGQDHDAEHHQAALDGAARQWRGHHEL